MAGVSAKMRRCDMLFALRGIHIEVINIRNIARVQSKYNCWLYVWFVAVDVCVIRVNNNGRNEDCQ